ncbi:hypothetical protein V5097_09805 [Arenibacter palladensis]|uniref:hypothetical protein n=1 Tax=Arenibacter palladensis TaxID=237373 RepID=UPI002FD3532F
MKILKIAFLLLAFVGILSSYGCQKDDDGNPDIETPKCGVPSILIGDWLESWSVYMRYSLDSLIYNPDTKVWFRGNYDAWSIDPRPDFEIRTGAEGEFIWATMEGTSSDGCQIYIRPTRSKERY